MQWVFAVWHCVGGASRNFVCARDALVLNRNLRRSVPRQANHLAVEEASVPELTRRAKWSNEEEMKTRQACSASVDNLPSQPNYSD